MVRLANYSLVAAAAAATARAAKLVADPVAPNTPFVNVTVAWSGVDAPAADDWVGAFCPYTNDSTAFITYQEVGTGAPAGKPYAYGPYIPYNNASAATWADGHGSVSFVLPNIRCDYDFLYFHRVPGKNGTSSNEVVAQAAEPVAFPPGQALGIHVAFTENPTQMRVSWNSDSLAEPIVYYRPRPAAGSSKAEPARWMQAVGGDSQTYTADDLCGSEAAEVQPENFIDPGYFHSAVLTGLAPGAVYEYYVSQTGSANSPTYAFRATPPPGAPVAFLMWADMGANQYNSMDHYGDVDRALDLINQVSQHEAIIDNPTFDDDAAAPVGLVTHVGDLSYGCGSGFIWEQWQLLIEPVATRVPYMVAVGNHEYDHEENSTKPGGRDISGVVGPSFHPAWGDYKDDSFGECGVPTAMRFKMPARGPSGPGRAEPTNGVFWYSFDYGPVHFTVWSSEHNFTKGSRQYAWLQQDLAATNKTRTPWLVVQMHRPMYASEFADGDGDKHLVVAQHIRDNLEDMFVAAGVDLVMTGHLHSYERTCAVLDNGTKCDEAAGGIVNVRVGTAGGPSDNCKAADPLCPNDDTMSFMPQAQAPWREVGVYEYGYSRVTVPNASALHIEFVLNNGTVNDETWLWKK